MQQLTQLATDGAAAGYVTPAGAAGGPRSVPLDALADLSLQASGGLVLPWEQLIRAWSWHRDHAGL